MSGANKRDREKLRERVKTELRKQGRSQKELEDGAGLAAGALTRVFNGRRGLDAEMVAMLCAELKVPPETLFAGTSFLDDLGSSPTTGDAEPKFDLPEFTLPDAAPSRAASEATGDGGSGEVQAAEVTSAAPEAPAAPAGSVEAEPEAAPMPAMAPASAPDSVAAPSEPPPATSSPRAASGPSAPAPEPRAPSEPPPRFRKRDIPLKAAQFVIGFLFGKS